MMIPAIPAGGRLEASSKGNETHGAEQILACLRTSGERRRTRSRPSIDRTTGPRCAATIFPPVSTTPFLTTG